MKRRSFFGIFAAAVATPDVVEAKPAESIKDMPSSTVMPRLKIRLPNQYNTGSQDL